MFKAAINRQMKEWHVENPNQLSKLVGIDYRTAVKAVNSDKMLSLIVVEKLAKFFKFKGYMEFRYYAIAYNAKTERDQA